MLRRDFLAAASGLIVGLSSSSELLSESKATEKPVYAGWVPDRKQTINFKAHQQVPMFADAAKILAGSGEGKKTLLWKFFEEVSRGPLIPHNQTVGDCFPALTMVQTLLGPVPIEDIQPGDEVFTGRGILTRVITTRELSSEHLIKIEITGGEDILATENQLFLVYRMGLVSGRRINKAYYERCVNGPTNQKVIQTFETRKPEWVRAEDLQNGDYVLTPKSIVSLTCPFETTPDWLFLLGHFIGDGHASGGTVEHTFDITEQKLCQTIKDVYEKRGFDPKYNEYKNRNACRLRIHSRTLVNKFRNNFYVDKEKIFPTWASGHWAILQGLKAADGFDNEQGHFIDNSSRRVIQGAYWSLVQLGAEPILNKGKADSPGRFPNAKPCYRIIWKDDKKKQYTWTDDHYYCRPVNNITKVKGQKVYDIGVKDSHHSFIANGVAVHNCVSQAWGLGIDFLDAIQIARGQGEWVAKCATEPIYAGGRVEIGKGAMSGDGMHGSWAGRWCRDYGILLRQPYLDGKYDFTRYSGSKARRWAHFCKRCTKWGGGVPDALEPIAKKHPVKTITLVTSWEQARDAIYNGYPVTVCSNYGFRRKRDKDGFSIQRGKWFHSMLLAGMDDTSSRPGGLFINSWGTNWINGPTRLDQPIGSFWVDADTIDGMLSQDDSFALSNYIGYPRQHLDYQLY